CEATGRGGPDMRIRQVAALVLCSGLSVLVSACATKDFVREHVGTTETRLGQRVDSTDAKVSSNTQALQRLDGAVGEAGALARDAKKDAAQVAAAQKESEATFNRRF